MKMVSAALAQHLAGEVTTLATCWKIARRDGVVVGLTDHVRDLEVDGVSCRERLRTDRDPRYGRPCGRQPRLRERVLRRRDHRRGSADRT